jgi:hypothetical protein
VDKLSTDRFNVLVAEMHDNALEILMVLSKILDFERRVHQSQRRNAEDGLRRRMA